VHFLSCFLHLLCISQNSYCFIIIFPSIYPYSNLRSYEQWIYHEGRELLQEALERCRKLIEDSSSFQGFLFLSHDLANENSQFGMTLNSKLKEFYPESLCTIFSTLPVVTSPVIAPCLMIILFESSHFVFCRLCGVGNTSID